MRILVNTICLSVCLFVVAQADPANDSKSINPPTAIAFVNVNVVPMDSERVVPGQNVIVREDRISEVGPVDTTEIPEGAVRIDGSGKYLMPGLADMHAHLNYYDMVNLFLANGVTTIRSMAGFDWQLTIRDKIQKGDLIGPTVHIAGPVIESNPPILAGSTIVETADQAAQLVAEHAKAGYEFIKVYDSLSLECFDAMIAAATKHGMPVVGHVPEAAGIEHALASGMHSIEHLVGYGPFLELGDGRFWTKIDEEKMLHIAKVTSEAGAWNCVTLVVMDKLRMTQEEVEQELKRPHMKYVPASVRHQSSEDRYKSANRIVEVSNMKRMVKALHDAGAKILLGTDSQAAYVVAGFSIHEELQNLVDAGLTPYEAIRAGTCDAAECLGQLDEFGVVSAGLRADLILVKGNPLEDVRHIEDQVGVMVRGHWLPEKELQEMLDRVEASHKPPENRFADIPDPNIEGEEIFSGRYEFVYGDSTIGAERIAVAKIPDGKNIVHAQLVVDPPYRGFAAMELVFDEAGKCYSLGCASETPAGKASLKMQRKGSSLTVSGKLASGKGIDITETIAEETLLGPCVVGSVMPLVQVAKSLKVGQTRKVESKVLQIMPDFSVFQKTITIERAADSTRQTQAGIIPIQIFNIDAESKVSSYKAVITMNKEGHLLKYERESEMGAFKFIRLE